MAFVKKVWKDRISEYPTRRTLTRRDGTTEVVTVARNEGLVSQEGDPFASSSMNNLEQRIANETDALDKSVAQLNTDMSTVKKSVSDGKTLVANAITAQGVTTATDAAFATMSANIKTVATNKYNAGVTYANSITNTTSASYKTGYNNGYSAGTASGYKVTDLGGATLTIYNNVTVSKTYTVSNATSIKFVGANGIKANNENTESIVSKLNITWSGKNITVTASNINGTSDWAGYITFEHLYVVYV